MTAILVALAFRGARRAGRGGGVHEAFFFPAHEDVGLGEVREVVCGEEEAGECAFCGGGGGLLGGGGGVGGGGRLALAEGVKGGKFEPVFCVRWGGGRGEGDLAGERRVGCHVGCAGHVGASAWSAGS